MSNGTDNKYRSRKWIIAVASFVVVTLFAGFGILVLAKDAGDVALIIGAWAASDMTILGIYNVTNVMQNRNGGRVVEGVAGS
jgi:hypothetical protein